MSRKQTTPKFTPHIRYWQNGQISVSAKIRIESLIENYRQREASTMISATPRSLQIETRQLIEAVLRE